MIKLISIYFSNEEEKNKKDRENRKTYFVALDITNRSCGYEMCLTVCAEFCLLKLILLLHQLHPKTFKIIL